MFQWLENRWNSKIRDYCDSQYSIITVLPGEINYYFRCHLVASHFARKNNHEKLALVVYRHTKDLRPDIHFINFDGENFIDNSVGYWSDFREYRFIRWIPEPEFFMTQNILEDTKRFFRDMAGFWTRLFCKLEN